MSNTQEILKTALLGTDKYMPNLIANHARLETSITGDKEIDFLRQTNMVLLMEEAGQIISQAETEMTNCAEETKNRVNLKKANLLGVFIKTNDEILFNYFIWYCIKSNQIIPPELAPTILNKAIQQVKISKPLLDVCGETGKWLCSLNKNWHVLLENNQDDQDWELGSLQTRKHYLSELRKTNPVETLEQLAKLIAKENANNRLELLSCLQINLSLQDEEFLQSLEKDKSQKVKDFATQLLLQIKDSSINKKTIQTLCQFFSIKEERHLLISKKKVLVFDSNFQPDEFFFQLGIEKVSSIKGVKDAEYWTFQLFSLIHPAQICDELKISQDEMLQLLIKSSAFKNLYHYIIKGIITFNMEVWAKELIENTENPSIELLNIINETSRKKYYHYYYNSNPIDLVLFLMDENYSELELDFAYQILQILQNNPYQNYANFYQKLALYLPNSILPKLNSYLEIENEEYQFKYFKNQIQEIIRIIETKQIILN